MPTIEIRHIKFGKEGVGEMVYKKYAPELLIAFAVGVNLLVVFSVQYFPYADIVNHLARYTLIHDQWFSGITSEYADIKPLPTAYIAVDMVGAALMHWFAPQTVMQVLAALCLITLPLGTYLFARVVAPQQRGLAVVAAMLSFNWYFLYGFLNYILGVAFALMVLSLWWPRRAEMNVAQMLLFGVSSAALYLVHMVGAALVLLFIGLEYALHVITCLRGRSGKWYQSVVNARGVLLLVVTFCVTAVWYLTQSVMPEHYNLTYSFRAPTSKLVHLATPFYSFSAPQAAVIASGYLVSLTLFLWVARRSIGFNLTTLLPLMLVAAYFAFPVALFGAYDVDVRFLLPAYLVAFMIPVVTPAVPMVRRVVYLLVGASVVHAGAIYFYAHAIDRDLRQFKQVLAQVPEGENVLPLVADRNRYGRIDPYRHFALWQVIDRRGRAPGLFSGDLSGQQMAHFVVTSHLYAPDEKWGTAHVRPLDWERVSRDYAFVVQAGDDPRVTATLEKNARPIYREGEFVLYAVASSDKQPLREQQ